MPDKLRKESVGLRMRGLLIWVQYSLGVAFCYWHLLLHSKASDAHIGIIDIFV